MFIHSFVRSFIHSFAGTNHAIGNFIVEQNNGVLVRCGKNTNIMKPGVNELVVNCEPHKRPSYEIVIRFLRIPFKVFEIEAHTFGT